MVTTRLYVEGGGDSKALRTTCREGFRRLIEKAGMKGRMLRIVACGGRQNAFESFATALAQATGSDGPMLLVDAEGPLTAANPWAHLGARDGWAPPAGATDDQCHLMVQVMESWFLADRSAVGDLFGQGFRESALPGNPQVEDIPKADVLDGLNRAVRDCGKGGYRKGDHSFSILGAIDPAKVQAVAPYAKRFFDTLRATVGGPP